MQSFVILIAFDRVTFPVSALDRKPCLPYEQVMQGLFVALGNHVPVFPPRKAERLLNERLKEHALGRQHGVYRVVAFHERFNICKKLLRKHALWHDPTLHDRKRAGLCSATAAGSISILASFSVKLGRYHRLCSLETPFVVSYSKSFARGRRANPACSGTVKRYGRLFCRFAARSFPMQSEVIIETRSLSKVYRDFWGRQKVRALKALDLEVRRGEIFGLLGPNGSGKTTTIKLMLGLLFPTSGQALVFGRDATEVTKNQRIGYLPEESYLYRFLNAEETLHFYGRLFKMPRAVRRQRVADLIEMVGLDWAKRRQLKEYSKGMTRRIGLAQALINDPELILLDEPTTGLDPIGTREMKDLILKLRDEGKTVLMCSHLLADVQDVCDRVAILYQGELKEMGRVDSLLKGPRRDRDSRRRPEPDRPGRSSPGDRAEQRTRAGDGQSHHHPGRPVPEDHPRERGPSRPTSAGSGRGRRLRDQGSGIGGKTATVNQPRSP